MTVSATARRVCTVVKVVLVSFSTLPTMQKYLYLAADELAQQGHDVWTVGSSLLQRKWELSDRNIVVDTPVSPRPSFRSLRASRLGLASVLDSIEAIQPDVVHFVNKHVWNYVLLQRSRLRLRGIDTKWVHTFHDPIGHHGDSVQRGVIAYHRLVQRCLDGVVVHSRVAEMQAVEVLNPRCRVVQVPLGVTRWKSFQAPSGARSALVFGRLNRYKGCEMYPAIFSEVHRLDPDIEIVVAGLPSKDLSPGLLEEIAGCPNVRYHGHFIGEADVDDYFRAARVVLTPYTSMTQSGVVLDAYSNGRPVLAFDIDGMPDFTPDSTQLVPSFDIEQYAKRVVELVNDLDACVIAGRQAWQFGLGRFTPASMADGLSAFYDSVVGSREGVEVDDA